jgi:hypothetical protein
LGEGAKDYDEAVTLQQAEAEAVVGTDAAVTSFTVTQFIPVTSPISSLSPSSPLSCLSPSHLPRRMKSGLFSRQSFQH